MNKDRIIALVLATLVAAALHPAARGQDAAPRPEDAAPTAEDVAPSAEDGPTYPVSEFRLDYVRENAQHPPLEELIETRVRLGASPRGYVKLRDGVPEAAFRLSKAPLQGTKIYYATGLQAVLEAIRDELIERQLIGVFVSPDPYEIDEQGRDLRPQGQTELTVLITTGAVTEMRTLASGERIDPERRVNNPAHDDIRLKSPVHPWEPGEQAGQRDLLRKDTLDRYVFFKSRHPGRRVDIAVSAAQEPGGVALDYLVTENRPLTFYGQVSNTGTESTGKWVFRAGLYHTQLTGNDDIFSVDYSTAQGNSHALLASYERPFAHDDRLRWRVYGLAARYNADQVGILFQEFEGKTWRVGGELIKNFWQEREAFADVFVGLRGQYESTENRTFSVSGQETFMLPYVGARFERITEWFTTQAVVSLEGQVLSTNQAELTALGRIDVDGNWVVLNWQFDHSVFLERLIDPVAWADPSTPKSSTLAHEIYGGFKGQYAFNYRLIPQAQSVIGGLYTVRGYPQSVAAGDTGLVGTAEYRYHLPRALGLEPEPTRLLGQPFRRAPQYVYGRPDWDLIFRGFFDLGFTIVNDPFFFEGNETLMGAGVGLEFQYRRNITARLDLGFALRDLPRAAVEAGDAQLHFALTLVY